MIISDTCDKSDDKQKRDNCEMSAINEQSVTDKTVFNETQAAIISGEIKYINL